MEIHCFISYPDTDLNSSLITPVVTYVTDDPDTKKKNPLSMNVEGQQTSQEK